MTVLANETPLVSPQELTRHSARRSAGWKGVWITLAVMLPIGLLIAIGPTLLSGNGPYTADHLVFHILAGSTYVTLLLLYPMMGFNIAAYRHDHRLSHAAEAWPVAPGVVEASDIVEVRDGESGVLFQPRLAYSFMLAGRRIAGTRRRFGDHGMEAANTDRKLAEETVRLLPAGAAIEVAYDPADPANNALHPVAFVWDRSNAKRQVIGLAIVALSPIVVVLVIYLFVIWT